MYLIYLFFYVLHSSSVSYVESSLKKHLASYNKLNYAYYFYDLKNDKSLLTHNITKQFSLASVSKLFITGAAIEILGLDFRFETKVYIDNKNNLYIKGGGDPLFVSESMWYLVNEIKNFGINNINNIYLDDTLFKEIDYKYIENDRAYSAIISPLLVNFNSITINVISGNKPLVLLDPNIDILKLEDKTKASNKKTNVNVRRKGDEITVLGNVNNLTIDNKKFYRNISSPIDYFSKTLALHLSWRGVKYLGEIKKMAVTNDAKQIFSVNSKRLAELLTDMNRFSNNLIAEELLLAICIKSGRPASTKVGAQILSNYLKKYELTNNSYFIENASGLTDKNKASLEFIVEYLKKIYTDNNIAPDFISSLSISGIDGTIKRTMNESILNSKVRAKTGTLNGVRSIAGYINTKTNNYIFAITINDKKAGEFSGLEQNIIKELFK